MKRNFDLAPIRSRFGPPFNATGSSFSSADKECVLDDDLGNESGVVPDRIQKLIAQRSAATSTHQQKQIPALGQIVRIPSPPNPLQPDEPNEHLAVLLEAPVGLEKWSCFVVTRDQQFAAYWDLVLGPEEEIRDPQCQLVQVWNRTTVDPSLADKVLCQLSTSRMAAVLSLATDYEGSGQHAVEGDSRPGVLLARELSDGTGVVTGTRIQLEDDPRVEYGALYRNAGVWIARQNVADVGVAPCEISDNSIFTAEPKFQGWIRGFFAAATGWRFASALATVAIGVLIVLNMEVAIDPTSPSGGQTAQAFKYISAGEIQEIKAKDPEQLVKQIADRFIAIGGFPETRKSGSQMFSLYITTAALERDKLHAILSEYHLNLPEDGVLRVDVVQEEIR